MSRSFKRCLRPLLVVLLTTGLLIVPPFTFAQDSGSSEDKPLPFFPFSTAIAEKVITDLSMYRNGTYTEHVRREERGRLEITGEAVTGNYYVLENAIRDAVRRGNRVDKRVAVELPASARLSEWLREKPFPRFRPFPFIPDPVPQIGTVWKAKTTMTVFPEHSGYGLVVPVGVTYRYDGTESFQGTRVHRVTGSIVLDSYPLDSQFVQMIRGTHDLTLLYDINTGFPIFIRDRLEDTYTLRDGDEIRYRGFINHWISYPATDTETDIKIFGELEIGDVEDVTRIDTEEGPALRINNLRFRPDLAELLSDEEGRLDRIAETLKNATEGTILVVGHAADTGNPGGELRLSRERARTITEELSARGVSRERLIYEGRGSTEPIASNDTEEGRVRNRRVEIILIEE